MNVETLAAAYGPLITMRQLAHILHWSEASIYNAVSADRLPIRTIKVGNRRYCPADALAEFINTGGLREAQ